MIIGQKIKNLRKHLNMSVDELAEKLGKNRATIYRYERGDIENLPLDVLEPLANALDTTPAYLMGWDEKESTDSPKQNLNINLVDTIGNTIKQLRLERSLTLEEFSNETGIPVEELKSYEDGKRQIPKSIIETLANFLNVTVDDLTSANITVNGTHMAYVSNSRTHVRHLKIWYGAIGDTVLKDEELYKIIEYAKFLLYLRDTGTTYDENTRIK